MLKHSAVALATTLLLGLAGALSTAAQPRLVLPAPPPDGPAPAWVDNDVTRRFAEWDQLERRWDALEASQPAPDFVRSAATICLSAASLPTEGEGRPGRRARVLKASCVGALAKLTDCANPEASTTPPQWSQGFERVDSAGRWSACGPLDSLKRVLFLVRQAGWDPSVASTAERTLALETREELKARDGRRILVLPACERVRALQTGLSALPDADRAALTLANAQTDSELARHGAKVTSTGARYVDVVAYHLAEARIVLYSEAQRDLASTLEDADINTVAEARDAFACLQDFRDAKAQLLTAERRLTALRAQAEKEAACLLDSGCMEQREARERQRVRRELQREQIEYEPASEQECCKVCHKGQACGDSCISRSKTCHKGPGCACDG